MTQTAADCFVPQVIPTTEAAGRDRLITLEIGRFLAATSVMLGHYTAVVEKARGERILDNAFGILHVGVPYFFVLSGFIIYHVHRKDIGNGATVGHFIKRRAIRLLPMFWLVSALMLSGFLLIPALSQERDLSLPGLVADFLLLPHAEAILSISWTLRHETIFYILFGLMLVLGFRAIWFIVAWIVVSLALSFLGLTQDGPSDLGSWSLIASPLNLGFGLGIAVAVLLRLRPLGRPKAMAAAAGLMMLAMLMLEWAFTKDTGQGRTGFGNPGTLIYLALSALLIWGLVAAETTWRVPAASTWKLLGGASYLLYLIHQPMASLALRVIKPLSTLPPNLVFVILSMASVVFAVVVHVLLERRILNWLSGRRAARV